MKTIQAALELVEYGEVEKGLDELSKLLPRATDDEKYSVAEVYYQLGFLREAKDLLNSLLEIYPTETELILMLAEVHIDLDEEEQAIILLGQVDEEEEEYPRVLLLLADLYQMQGLDEVAEQKLLKAKQLLPNNSILQFALGEFYSGRGNYKQSIPYYEEVVKVENHVGDISVHLRLAESYASTGLFEEAFTHYEKGLADKVEIDSLFGYACSAYQVENYKTAINKLLELKDMDPTYSPLYLVLAKAYEAEELITEAQEAIQEGIKVDEYNKELYVFGGKLAMKLGNYEQAKILLVKARELDHESIEAAFLLTRIYINEGDFEKVVPIVEAAIESGDEDPQMIWDIAIAKKELEEYSDALKHYRAAYTFFKDQPDFLEEYGRFLLEEGLRQEALVQFKHLLSIDQARIDIEELVLQLENES
ncbi:tetratricopeptide (TPR) repeat protein [Bacillus mesophilus]|uniref:Tetratricopeptide repeat protein n=1 Tax=Bacillus mesophilus TaxID=1808955 RepID=A0A6M0Q4A0_9BACI|nr:tetratricopeptide repeat protein [Bacillus mesophilus]MBM7661262.1 tetratricopeptide (TPR) repeat protein [Bacillus mesophilus]NEY71215.1 tetratricopeptide repeat protein [Bacillus mesophilus]